MNKIFKRTTAALLSVIMLATIFTALPFTANAAKSSEAAGAKSGTTGDCTWYLDDDYDTLTISGNGVMADKYPSFPSGTKHVVIEDGVTRIGKYAFNNMFFTSVTIPDSVESVGESAFNYCINLESINGGNGIKEIGRDAFRDTKWLDNQPDGLVYLGKCVLKFKGNSSEDVVIRPGTLSIASNAFEGREKLTNITLPDSLETIGKTAFEDCTGLVSIVLPVGLKSIGEFAFQKCSGLKVITIPYGITKINDYTFNMCSGLIHAEIPETVISIGECAFRSCNSMKSVTIPASVTEIGEQAFGYAYNGRPVKLDGFTIYGKTGTAAEQYAKENGFAFIPTTEPSTTKSGTTGDCTWTLDDEGTLTVSGNGKMEDYSYREAPWGDQITSVVINNGVTSIGQYAFYDCAELTDVTIPGSVTSIGNNAFEYCTGLTGVDIPDSVKTIGAMAFSDCTGLTSVNIPDGVKNIAFQTFCNCSNLTDITIPASVTSVGYEAFTGCTELSGVYISDLAAWCGISFSDMAANPLSNAHKLYLNKEPVTDLAIPESVTGIGNYAFSGNTELTSVTIPDNVTSIGDWAFSDCTGLTGVTIGNGTTEIGRYAFEGCTGLTGVTIPETVTTIGEKAFGYYYADDEYNKLADFTIYSKKGSAAEAYANENGFKFVDDAKPLVGDVNGDDVVNGADAGVLNRYASGWSGYADKIKNMTAADINNDGKVNGADAGILSRYVSGWTQYAKFFVS